jgi:hypothetical protein
MADSSKVAWIAAAASLGAAVVSAYFAFQQKKLETETKTKEIALQQSQFEAQERRRFEDVLGILIPKLLSRTSDTATIGRATLYVLYPDRAGEVMKSINDALSEQQRTTIAPQVRIAVELQARSADWFVIAGGSRSESDTTTLRTQAVKAGFPAVLFYRDEWFRLGIGPYPQRTDAESAKIAVSATLDNSAYVVQIARWCPTRAQKPTYVECRR